MCSIDYVRSALMGAKVSETLLSGSMLEIDAKSIAEDIAASTVPLAEWKVTPITCGRVLSGKLPQREKCPSNQPGFLSQNPRQKSPAQNAGMP